MASNLPPGCTNSDIERAMGGDYPPQCDDCEFVNDELNTCPYDGAENYCVKVALIKECANCKKPICKVEGLFKREEVASAWDNCFCCSKKCADELTAKFEKDVGIKESEQSKK